MTAPTTHVVDDLQPVTLDEVLTVAGLQARRDRKYLLPAGQVADVLLDAAAEVDRLRALDIDGRRQFRYESLYFDTDDHISYLGAAHRRPQRFKVRTRTYLDTSTSMLEVKVRSPRGATVKHRHPYQMADRDRLTADGRAFVASIEPVGEVVDGLRPALRTTYRRATVLCGDGAARATIDSALEWRSPAGAGTTLPGLALIETKTSGAPCALDRVLWRHGVRPTTISKYCTGLAALHPELPANKWHRVLWRHLERRGAPQPVDDQEVGQLVERITERIVSRSGLDVAEQTVRAEVHRQFIRLAERATVHTYLGILTERAVMARLASDTPARPPAG